MNENAGFGCFIVNEHDESIPQYIGYDPLLDSAKELACNWVKDSDDHTLIIGLLWNTHLRENGQVAATLPVWEGTTLVTLTIHETPANLIPVLAANAKETIE